MAELGHHDGIVQAFDMDAEGGPEGETLILALEYMPGGSLETKLATAGKPLPVTEVVRILREIAEALCHLHARDVVHRDLKPGNILLDAAGRANITDLGLAQVPNGLSMRTRTFSQWREHPGTPQYMSPEQQNSRAYLTPASDCYTLGLMAFEMLTARVTRNQPPGTRVRQLQPNCPVWLDDLIADMLQPDPHQRPWNAEQVLARLQAGEAASAAAEAESQQRAHAQAKLAAEQAAERERQAREVAAQAVRQKLQAEQAAERERQAREVAAQAERQKAQAEQAAERERQAREAVAQAERQKILAEQIAQHRRQTEAAIAAARWGEAMRHARAWLALQPDNEQALAALRLAQDQQSKASNARTRRALLLGGGGAGVLGLGYAALRLLPTGGGAAPAMPPTTASATATRVPSAVNRLSDNLAEVTLAPGVTIQFVRIPAGEFVMGSDKAKDLLASDDELPQHRLSLPEYWMGKTEVTVAQFAAFVRATNYSSAASKDTVSKANHPVVDVTWNDCMAFCKWASEVSKASVSLPSEAEWEKAARGPATSSGADRIYPWGNEAPDATRCNFNNNERDTTPVSKYGARGASPYGCDDMAGNVWEWTRSAYKAYRYKADDGRENIQNTERRVLRGGAFGLNGGGVRVSNRYYDNPGSVDFGCGFRLVYGVFPIL